MHCVPDDNNYKACDVEDLRLPFPFTLPRLISHIALPSPLGISQVAERDINNNTDNISQFNHIQLLTAALMLTNLKEIYFNI